MNRRDRRAEAAQRRRLPLAAPSALGHVAAPRENAHVDAPNETPRGPVRSGTAQAEDRARRAIARAGDEQREATAELLAGARTADAVVRACASAHVRSNALSEPIARQDPRIACREGCSWCCRLRVSSTSLEVLGIAAWVNAELPAATVREVRRRSRALADETAGMAQSERPPRPCPLLENDRCLAYTARPLACRGWNSFDPAPCRAYVEGQADAAANVNERLILLSRSLLGGLAEAARNRDLDGEAVDFGIALGIVLENPDAMGRWLNGDNPLAPARIVTEAADGRQRLGLVP